MTRHLLRCALLACIACHAHAWPWNFFAALLVTMMAVAWALVWRDEYRATKPHPATSWLEPVTPLPSCVARAAVTRKKGVVL